MSNKLGSNSLQLYSQAKCFQIQTFFPNAKNVILYLQIVNKYADYKELETFYNCKKRKIRILLFIKYFSCTSYKSLTIFQKLNSSTFSVTKSFNN